jgi:hypothetical protein
MGSAALPKPVHVMVTGMERTAPHVRRDGKPLTAPPLFVSRDVIMAPALYQEVVIACHTGLVLRVISVTTAGRTLTATQPFAWKAVKMALV